MVSYMDKLIGKIVDRLDDLGLRENTLLLFLGDNGTGKGTESRMGDRVVAGGKGTMLDTGTHVPLIANWPGRVTGGRVCPDLVDSADFLPTICEAAGVALPADLNIDGRSFWPQLQGEPGTPRAWRYCWYGPRDFLEGEFAASQAFKLYADGRFFDLRTDLGETQALPVASLQGEAAAAAQLLKGALDGFKGVRPADRIKPEAGKEGGKKKQKSAEGE